MCTSSETLGLWNKLASGFAKLRHTTNKLKIAQTNYYKIWKTKNTLIPNRKFLGSDLNVMPLISKVNKKYFLLCLIDIFSKYIWDVPL